VDFKNFADLPGRFGAFLESWQSQNSIRASDVLISVSFSVGRLFDGYRLRQDYA